MAAPALAKGILPAYWAPPVMATPACFLQEEQPGFVERHSGDRRECPRQSGPDIDSKDFPPAERYQQRRQVRNRSAPADYSVPSFPWVWIKTVPKRVPEPCGSIETRCSSSLVPALISHPSPCVPLQLSFTAPPFELNLASEPPSWPLHTSTSPNFFILS